MTARLAIATVGCLAAGVGSAAAQPAQPPTGPTGPTVVVLRLDRGPGVDVALTERLQKEIEAQATRAGLQVTAGTESLADTAAVAGCTAKVIADCREPILDTLGVDELVYGSVEPSMSGPHVTVSRAKKGLIPAKISVDLPDKDVDAAATALQPSLATLFPVADAGAATGAGAGAGAAESGTGAVMGTGLGAGTGIGAEPVDAPSTVNSKKVLFISGVSLGAAMFVTGMACWFKTSSLNGDIDDAPDDTLADIARLKDLEDSAASYARWGNVLVVLGLAVGGGAALWWHYTGRTSPPRPAARVEPWVTPDGGGVTLTWSTP